VRRIDRRGFLLGSAGVGGVLVGGPFQGLVARAARAQTGCPLEPATGAAGYGPLTPRAAQNRPEVVLALPKGFKYTVLSRTGQLMADGRPTPAGQDGMAAFPAANGNVRLVRNHEIPGFPTPAFPTPGAVGVPVDPLKAYDPGGPGGTTTLEIDPRKRRVITDFVSLGGTVSNCAGGPTPWASWISCEETTLGGEPLRHPHGYCFEVPSAADAEGRAEPLVAMGRFVHEAVAVDVATGLVYETEDQARAGFYRFLPDQRGVLAAGGRLEMLAVAGQPNYDTATGQTVGCTLPVTWVAIDDPDPAGAEQNPSAVHDQGAAKGGARFARLEGCWYGQAVDGSSRIFFSSTAGGDRGHGQIWEYRPSTEQLVLLFESADTAVLDRPDNLTVSPRGGIVICEDGGGQQYVRGLTRDGRVFDFARNQATEREFAGATFSPDGQTLFVNIQGDGLRQGYTLAVWGPWEVGGL
jgi:secreted PhoX family phosphatase